jgi:hypothetical protein
VCRTGPQRRKEVGEVEEGREKRKGEKEGEEVGGARSDVRCIFNGIL